MAGKTVQQLQDHLLAVYGETVKGAVVTVIVKEIKSRPVYFVGGFAKSGVLQLTGELLRRNQKVPIDFNRLAQRGDQNPKLEPGDSVVVPLAQETRPGQVRGRPHALERGSAEKKDRIRVDVDRITRSPDGSPDVRLQPNDITTVPQRHF